MPLAVLKTWFSRKPTASASIVAALVSFLMIVLSGIYQQDVFHAHDWMGASKESVFVKHEYWRLWTTLFAHSGLAHLLANSLLFYVLGYFLNGYYGLFVFPVMAFFFGGLTNIIVLQNMPADIQLIGMSGVVYWMGGAWLALYYAIDLRRTHMQRALRSAGVALGVFMPASTFDPSISYGAHLVGFLIGIAFGTLYYVLRRQEFTAAIVYETPEPIEPVIEEEIGNLNQ